MINRWTRVALVAMVAGGTVLTGASDVSAEELPGTSLFATGSSIWVRFVSSEAWYSNDVSWSKGFDTAEQSGDYLFSNHVPWEYGRAPRKTVYAWDGQVEAGNEWVEVATNFQQWEEVVFSIYVNDTGKEYFTGSASRNPDGLVHAQVDTGSEWDDEVRVGFEDLDRYRYGGAASIAEPDFDDVVLQVRGVSTVTPEPASMILLGSGLAGLGGIARRRKREALEKAKAL